MGTKANIARVKIHERYERDAAERRSPVNDIAIVTLDTRVTSPRVTPVCLPQECSVNTTE